MVSGPRGAAGLAVPDAPARARSPGSPVRPRGEEFPARGPRTAKAVLLKPVAAVLALHPPRLVAARVALEPAEAENLDGNPVARVAMDRLIREMGLGQALEEKGQEGRESRVMGLTCVSLSFLLPLVSVLSLIWLSRPGYLVCAFGDLVDPRFS